LHRAVKGKIDSQLVVLDGVGHGEILTDMFFPDKEISYLGIIKKFCGIDTSYTGKDQKAKFLKNATTEEDTKDIFRQSTLSMMKLSAPRNNPISLNNPSETQIPMVARSSFSSTSLQFLKAPRLRRSSVK